MKPELQAIKEAITESLGAEQATKIVESLEAYTQKVGEDAIKEASEQVQAKIEEGVQANRIQLEADYLAKMDAAKKEADEAVAAEVKTFESRLAARCKALLESGLEQHGDRLAKIAEDYEAKEGSALFERLEQVFDKAKQEITEANKVDPEEVKVLKGKVTALEMEVAKANRQILEARAAKNVAEQQLQQIRENADAGAQVTIVEDDKSKGKAEGAAATNTKVDDGTGVVKEGEEGKQVSTKEYPPMMTHMRRMAGIVK